MGGESQWAVAGAFQFRAGGFDCAGMPLYLLRKRDLFLVQVMHALLCDQAVVQVSPPQRLQFRARFFQLVLGVLEFRKRVPHNLERGLCFIECKFAHVR